MLKHPPTGVAILFLLTTLFTLWFLYKSSKSIPLIIGSILWMVVQAIIGHSNFYLDATRIPPRPFLLVGPPLLFIIILFSTKKGRAFIDSFDEKWLTYLHSVRIPVEVTLLFLYLNNLIPQLMTFEGRNFDILSGISAPIVAYFGYTKKSLSKKTLLAWNFICLGLLFNIVINALLSMPTIFQKQGFDQPNTGLLFSPYLFLPCFIVPAVLLSHLVCIRKLIIK
jgi:hypothetical protein